MIGRPLSPLLKITFSRPAPGLVSFLVSQRTRKPPVSLVKVSVWTLPRPDHDPTSFQITTSFVGGGGVRLRQAAALAPAVSAATIARTSFISVVLMLSQRVLPDRAPPRRARRSA